MKDLKGVFGKVRLLADDSHWQMLIIFVLDEGGVLGQN